MTDNSATKGGTLIRIKMVPTELATSHPTDGMNEVGPVEVFKPVLIRVMGVGTTIEVVGRRILPTLLITCIL